MNDIEIVQLDDFRKQHIAVLCLPGLESFLPDIVRYLERTYAVRTYYGRSLPEIESLINWCDLVWIEWANELAIELTNKIPMLANKQVIIRLHSYEALAPYVQQIKWTVVNVVIFVANHIRDIVYKSIPRLPEMVDVFVVPNGV